MTKEILFEMVNAAQVAGLTRETVNTLDSIKHDHNPVFDELRINTAEHSVTVEYWQSGAPCTTTVDYDGNVVYDYNAEQDDEYKEEEEVVEMKEVKFNPSATFASAYAMVQFIKIIEGSVQYVEDGLTVRMSNVTADKYVTIARAVELCNMCPKPMPEGTFIKEDPAATSSFFDKEKVVEVKDTVVKAATVAAKATGFFAGAFGRACKVGYSALKEEYNKR